MTTVLLFCISEEAKPQAYPNPVRPPSSIDVKVGSAPDDVGIFSLVESNICPRTKAEFRHQLGPNETSSSFVGASVEDCQAWALEKQFQVNFIEQDLIAIVDTRSARDETVAMYYYARSMDSGPPLEFGEFGVLPRETNVWYEYRVHYNDSVKVQTSLGYGPIDITYPAYFGMKEELTDEKGVFDAARADRLTMGDESFPLQIA